VFSTVVCGAIIDTVTGNPKKGLSALCSEKDSFIGQWFERIHKLHEDSNPMDYQGFKMGGYGHRLRSIGHDLLGFAFGIWQIMNGTFTGGYYQNGKYNYIISKVNEHGGAYKERAFVEAVWTYTGHVFCDFFSTHSIPIPGFSFLAKMPSREIRNFAADMYNNGYNLRHMFIQGFSVLFTELTLRAYTYFRYGRDVDIEKVQLEQKKHELLLLAHSIIAAVNVGKVIITKNPLTLNLPQIMAVGYHFAPYVIFHYRNNNQTRKILRNLEQLEMNQYELERKLSLLMLESHVFQEYLHTEPILLE